MSDIYIAGYDGTDAAEAAVRFAQQLAEAAHGEVLVAGVYETVKRVYAKGDAGGAKSAIDEESRAETERLLDVDALTGFGHCAVGAGSPAEGLQLLAEEREAAMLVVGVTHRGALGRVAPGSVGERLLHGAPCAVAAVPADHVPGPIRTVAVAYAGTPESDAALRFAAELARGAGAKVVALRVGEPILAFAGTGTVLVPVTPDDALTARIAEETSAAVARLGGDVATEVRVLAGAPGQALVAACLEGVDVLVTGSRGYGPARSVLMGTVSRHLVDHAPCPVVVVPRPVAAAVKAEPLTAAA